jgi:hypothetical protein
MNMGETNNPEDEIRKRFINKFASQISGMNNKAENIVNSYYNLLLKDQKMAIQKLPEYIERARDINPERDFVETVAGPNHDWTGPIMDMLGAFYPSMDKDTRKIGLLKCLGFLDYIRSDYCQYNVEMITEPWLVADIVINRPLYWCGYMSCGKLLQENTLWSDFSKHLDSVQNMFLMSMAVTEPKYASAEIRYYFYDQYPEMIDRTLDAIAAIVYDSAQRHNKYRGTNVQEYINEHIAIRDKIYHKQILRKMDEKKWIKLDEY